MFEGALALYYEIFTFIEHSAILDPFNEIDLVAIHYVHIPLRNGKLDTWFHAWSKHQMHAVKTSLLRSWVSSQINCSPQIELTEQKLYML